MEPKIEHEGLCGERYDSVAEEEEMRKLPVFIFILMHLFSSIAVYRPDPKCQSGG